MHAGVVTFGDPFGLPFSEAVNAVELDATPPAAAAWDVAVVVRLVTVDLAAVVVVLMTVVIVIVAFVVLVVVDIVVVVAAFVVLVVVDLVLVVRTVVVVVAAVVVVLVAVFVVVIAFVIVVASVVFEVRVAPVVPSKWLVELVVPRPACLVRVLADAMAVLEAAVLATVGFVIAETVVPAVSSTA